MHVLRKCHGDHQIWTHLVTKYTFRPNLTVSSKQKTFLTKVVKEYAFMKEMSHRTLNME